jgi:peptidoglycan/xylan/chitin deacetylase (PgdA/CDA1 family)
VADDLVDRARGALPATFFINSDRLGASGYLGWSDLDRLAADGHEIASHNLAHTRMLGLSLGEDLRLACDDRASLIAGRVASGAPPLVANFAFPFGANDAVAETAVASCLDSARDIGGVRDPGASTCSGCPWADSVPPRDLFAIRTPSSLSGCPSADTLRGYVDRAVAGGGGWLHLVFHHIALDPSECGEYVVERDALVALLDYLQTQVAAGTVRVVRARDVVGFANPSFERAGASDGDPSDCWERVTYIAGAGSFARVASGHSGGSAESISNGVVASRKLLADRRRPECLPAALPGHRYRLSTWYQYLSGDGSAANVKLVVYYRDAAGKWIYLRESPTLSASTAWARAAWDTPAIPAEATGVTAGVAVTSVGQLFIDDLLLTDLGPGGP